MTQDITDKGLGNPMLLYFLRQMNILSSDYGLIILSTINPFITGELWNLPLALSLRFKVDKGQQQVVFEVSEKT